MHGTNIRWRSLRTKQPAKSARNHLNTPADNAISADDSSGKPSSTAGEYLNLSISHCTNKFGKFVDVVDINQIPDDINELINLTDWNDVSADARVLADVFSEFRPTETPAPLPIQVIRLSVQREAIT